MVAAEPTRHRVHLIVGGYPVGNPAAHDHDYARLRLLNILGEREHIHSTIAGDFEDIEKWLPGCELLITYTAGPLPDEGQLGVLEDWITKGGRWLALHGSSGGRARRVPDMLSPSGKPRRRVLRSPYHDVLGGFFINHAPLRRFDVDVVDTTHPITAGVPAVFETIDEPYQVEVFPGAKPLLTARLGPDRTPPGFGFVYDEDTALLPDGETYVLGYVKESGLGGVCYFALGHNHAPTTQPQSIVDESVAPGGITPPTVRGSWEKQAYIQLLRNAINWGLEAR